MLTSKINTDGTVDLTAKQGTTWTLTHSCFTDIARTIPMPLTGLSARGQLRKDYKSASPVLLELVCEVLEMDEETNPSINKILISATPVQSSGLTTLSGVYDVEVFDTEEDVVERVMEGKFTISPEVTRPIPEVTP